jgi:hypothetical protein
MTRNDRKRLARILADPIHGPKFIRLRKRQQADILLHLRGAAAKRAIREEDAARRTKVRERSAERRAYRRAVASSLEARRDAVAAKLVNHYGMGPQAAENLRHNLQAADAKTLSRLEDANGDQLESIIRTQAPDGQTLAYHYHTRR